MATSLTSTGVTFPDATTQTTAATSAGGTLEAVASGALSTGDMVVVNTDGTVSVASQTIEDVEPATTGSEIVFNATSTQNMAALYDPDSKKVIVAYRDTGGSNEGEVLVGEVSGTSISFGSPVAFYTANSPSQISMSYDTVQQKVVIAFRSDAAGSYGYAIVGTVSGNSMTFGTATQFLADIVSYTSCVYDVASGKTVIFYRNGSNNYGYAIVATVSGTSISFGTAVVFNSADSRYCCGIYEPINQVCVAAYFDATNNIGRSIAGTVSGASISFGSQYTYRSTTSAYTGIVGIGNEKFVVVFRDASVGPNYGRAVVGTVSGTSISYGSISTFNPGESDPNVITYDSVGDKIAVATRNVANGYGLVVGGTISGTTITFGDTVTFNPATGTQYLAMTYDPVADKSVIFYQDGGNSSYGTCVTVETSSASTTLTSENYIGVSDGNYSDTDTATVLIAGSVSDAQTGLTAGQTYYVQKDGTLSTTPDDPSVFAGTAISSTKLIVQG